MKTSELATYYVDILKALGQARFKKMFNVFCIYINEKPVGFLCGEELLVKTNAQMREKWPDLPKKKLFPEAANEMWVVEDPDNNRLLLELFRHAYENLAAPSPKKTRKKVKKETESEDSGPVSGSPLGDKAVMGKDVLTPAIRKAGISGWIKQKAK